MASVRPCNTEPLASPPSLRIPLGSVAFAASNGISATLDSSLSISPGSPERSKARTSLLITSVTVPLALPFAALLLHHLKRSSMLDRSAVSSSPMESDLRTFPIGHPSHRVASQERGTPPLLGSSGRFLSQPDSWWRGEASEGRTVPRVCPGRLLSLANRPYLAQRLN